MGDDDADTIVSYARKLGVALGWPSNKYLELTNKVDNDGFMPKEVFLQLSGQNIPALDKRIIALEEGVAKTKGQLILVANPHAYFLGSDNPVPQEGGYFDIGVLSDNENDKIKYGGFDECAGIIIPVKKKVRVDLNLKIIKPPTAYDDIGNTMLIYAKQFRNWKNILPAHQFEGEQSYNSGKSLVIVHNPDLINYMCGYPGVSNEVIDDLVRKYPTLSEEEVFEKFKKEDEAWERAIENGQENLERLLDYRLDIVK